MALSHAGVLLILLASVGISGYFVLSHNLDRSSTRSIEATAAAEADRLAEEGAISAPPDSDTPSAAATRIAVYSPTGAIAGEAADVPAWLYPRSQHVTTIVVGRERVRIVTEVARATTGPIATVVAAKSLAPQEDLLSDLRWLLVWGGLTAAALSFAAGWLLAGAAVKPIRNAYGAQERFAADASHELRTPLAFLRAGAEVTSEHDAALGDQMLKEIDYLSSLTSRLLALARARSGRSDVVLEPVHVRELVTEAVQRAERNDSARISIEPNTDPVAMADPILLEAALDAVLENVSEHGGGDASLALLSEDGHVAIAVSDRGPGLSRELRARALEPFFRADPARSRSRGGAGLGLALAASLVHEQGGSLDLAESEGGGLRVSITLQAARTQA
ncbi:MAG TPA: HAMP domain-containing sensor histidine kinase [Actinomycetota bacterium]|nr:HAMP domain-containing sensor histidine kinase [Actinomycetota bacterium]